MPDSQLSQPLLICTVNRARDLASGGTIASDTTVQQAHDLLFKDWDVCRANVLSVDTTIPAHQEGNRQTENSPVTLPNIRRPHHDEIVHPELLVKISYRLRSVVHGNADNLQPFVLVLVLKIDKMRDLLAARFRGL